MREQAKAESRAASVAPSEAGGDEGSEKNASPGADASPAPTATPLGAVGETDTTLWDAACGRSMILLGMMQPDEDAETTTRLQPPLTYPSLQEDYSRQMIPLEDDAMISQLFEAHPWSDGARRVKLCQFLQSLMLCSDRELKMKGTLGVWELSSYRDCHHDINGPLVWLLVNQLRLAQLELAIMSMHAMWALSVSVHQRFNLVDVGATEMLVQALRWTYCVPPKGPASKKKSAPAEQIPVPAVTDPATRDRIQEAALGCLAMLVVDRGVRLRLMIIEPSLRLFFGLARHLPGYQDLPGYQGAWWRKRRLVATQLLTNVLIRDTDMRYQLVEAGQLGELVELLNAEGACALEVQELVSIALHGLAQDARAMALVTETGNVQVMSDFAATDLNS
jgi:hypothetical protein